MSCRAAAFFPSSVQAQVSAKEPVFVPAQFHTYAIAIVRVPDTPIIQERLHGKLHDDFLRHFLTDCDAAFLYLHDDISADF